MRVAEGGFPWRSTVQSKNCVGPKQNRKIVVNSGDQWGALQPERDLQAQLRQV